MGYKFNKIVELICKIAISSVTNKKLLTDEIEN